MKRCPACGLTKAFDEFPLNKRTASGYATYCKPCHNAKGKASRERSGGARKYHLWRRYGLALADHERMLVEQDNLCAVCGEGEPRHVDHDHVTGRVRGLLCFGCNGGLGQFRDDPARLRAAAAYLERSVERDDLPVVNPQRFRGTS
jgi:hypothetical protein